jgi:hypothetical protein
VGDGVRPTLVNIEKLDRLLLERFGGKVGRGQALESSRRCELFHLGGISLCHTLTGLPETSANRREG